MIQKNTAGLVCSCHVDIWRLQLMIFCDWCLKAWQGRGVIHSSKSSEAFETGFIFTNNLITSFSICVHNHSSEPPRLWHWSVCRIRALWGLRIRLSTRVRVCVGNGSIRSSSSRNLLFVFQFVKGIQACCVLLRTVDLTRLTLWTEYFCYTWIDIDCRETLPRKWILPMEGFNQNDQIH